MAILNFQKPDKVIMIDSTESHVKFEFRPLEPGYGLTIGNALRRVLLSSLEGYAFTSVKIDGVDHEFSTIDGVVEDVTEIILNIKQIRLKRQIDDVENEKINVIWNSELNEIVGEENPLNVTGIKLKSTVDDTISDLKVDGVFIAIGHDPATQIFKGQVDMDDSGYIITQPDSTLTNIEGVYAAGDVKDKIYRQAVTAAGMGCMAALEAEKYISSLE